MTRPDFKAIATFIAVTTVAAGCAGKKPQLPPTDDRLGSVSELQASQFGHIDRAAAAVEEARKANR